MDSVISPAAEKVQRKRRTKEEIEQEKLEKQLKKIEREQNAARNSKCEQFLFCYVDTSICALDDGIRKEIDDRCTERSLVGQLTFVDGEYGLGKVVWKRKRIDAMVDDGKVTTLQTLDKEGCFMHILDLTTFGQMMKKSEFGSFVDRITKEHRHPTSLPNIVVYGQGGPRDTATSAATLEAFEQSRTQVRYCKTAQDLSYLIIQLHRGIAKSEKRLTQDNSLIINVEKGIKDGDLGVMKNDWWTRMLSHTHRLSAEQKRALTLRWPHPIDFMDELLLLKPDEAVKMIANVVATNGRRIGPAAAKTIYAFMTSIDGDEVVIAS